MNKTSHYLNKENQCLHKGNHVLIRRNNVLMRKTNMLIRNIHVLMRNNNILIRKIKVLSTKINKKTGLNKMCFTISVRACQVHRWTCPWVEIQDFMIIRPHATIQRNRITQSRALLSQRSVYHRFLRANALANLQPAVNRQPGYRPGDS